MDEGQAAFRAGRAAMTIDGTFRLGAFGAIKDFEWGVTELPASADGKKVELRQLLGQRHHHEADGREARGAPRSSWPSSPRPRRCSSGSRRSASCRPARPRPMTERTWTDPIYGPFLKALDYAQTTLFVDELGAAPGRASTWSTAC